MISAPCLECSSAFVAVMMLGRELDPFCRKRTIEPGSLDKADYGLVRLERGGILSGCVWSGVCVSFELDWVSVWIWMECESYYGALILLRWEDIRDIKVYMDNRYVRCE